MFAVANALQNQTFGKEGETMKFNASKALAIMANSGLTYAQVAKRGEISRTALSDAMKRGTCRPEALGRIARGLGVNAETIMYLEGSP